MTLMEGTRNPHLTDGDSSVIVIDRMVTTLTLNFIEKTSIPTSITQ